MEIKVHLWKLSIFVILYIAYSTEKWT